MPRFTRTLRRRIITFGCSIFTLYLIIFALPSIWKLFRVASFLKTVDIGEDTFAPSYGKEQIPAIIHHYTPASSIPDKFDKAYHSAKGVHLRYGEDAYEFKLWNDLSIENFISKSYPDFLPTFQSYEYDSQRIDAAKYFVLMQYGGIFLDIDVGLERSLDNLRRLDGVTTSLRATLLLRLSSFHTVSDDVLMVAAQHPFMHFVTERLTSGRYGSLLYFLPFISTMWSTGPLFLSVALYDFLAAATPAQRLEAGLFSPKSERSIFFHEPNEDWMGWDGHLLCFMWYFVLPWIWVGLRLSCAAIVAGVGLVVCAQRLKQRSGAKDKDGGRKAKKRSKSSKESVEPV